MGKKEPLNWKRILYGASLLIALAGFFILTAFTFLINDALDKTEASLMANMDALTVDLQGVSGALDSMDTELGTMNTTLDKLQGAFGPLASGMNATGNAISGLADSISQIPLLGQAASSDLRTSASSIKQSAAGLSDVEASFTGHKENLANLKLKAQDLKASIDMQRATLAETRDSVESVFGLLRIANLLFFLAVISMFVMLSINSIAGFV